MSEGRAWTLENVRVANEAAGDDFFAHDARQNNSDPASFRIDLQSGRVWLVRIVMAQWQKKTGNWGSGKLGEVREFLPETGFITSVVPRDGSSFVADRRPSVAA